MRFSPLSRGKGACRVIPHNTDHIWISDEVLTEALLRFTRRTPSDCKRYGSNVPGPLEARRRLARRKLGGMAFQGDFAPTEPSIGMLFGSRGPSPLDWRYEPPGISAQPIGEPVPRASLLPPWLQSLAGSRSGKGPSQKAASTRLETFLDRDLPSISNMVELRSRIIEQDILHLWNIPSSERAFDRLLETSQSVQNSEAVMKLSDFLRDPSLNVSYMRNFEAWIGCISDRTRGLNKKIMDPLLQTVKDMCTQHKLDVDKSCTILNTICQMKSFSLNTNTPKKSRHSVTLFTSLWEVLSDGHSHSKELSYKFLHILLRELWTERGLHVHGKNDVLKNPYASIRTVAAWTVRMLGIAAIKSHDTRKPIIMPRTGQVCFNGYAAALTDALKIVPPSFRYAWMDSTTAKLVRLGQLGRATTTVLRIWLGVIRMSEDHFSETTDYLVDSNVLANYDTFFAKVNLLDMVEHFQEIGPRATSQLLWKLWVPKAVGVSSSLRIRTLLAKADEKYRARLISGPIFKDDEWDDVWCVAAILQSFETSRRVSRKLWEPILKVVHKCWGVEGLAKLNRQCGTSLRICHSTPTDPSKAFGLYRARYSLRQFGSPGFILRQMDVQYVPIVDIRRSIHQRNIRSIDQFSHPNHISAINSIAIKLAKDRYRTPRESFTAIYVCCFQPLRSQRVPVPPTVTQALVYAGITRALMNNEWVSTTQIRLILRFVRIAEGRAKAIEIERTVWEWRGKIMEQAREACRDIRYPLSVAYVQDAKKLGLL